MVMLGAWEAGYKWHAVIAVFGVVITAVYLLRAVRNTFFGPRLERWDKLQDARGWLQKTPFVLLLIVLLVFGCYPKPMTDVIREGVAPIVAKVRKAQALMKTGQALPPPPKEEDGK